MKHISGIGAEPRTEFTEAEFSTAAPFVKITEWLRRQPCGKTAPFKTAISQRTTPSAYPKEKSYSGKTPWFSVVVTGRLFPSAWVYVKLHHAYRLGLRVVIYPNDHRPPHVHVLGAGTEAVFNLQCPAGPPTLRGSFGFATAELNRIASALADNLTALCAEWERIHHDH